jgi:hypothetical protein
MGFVNEYVPEADIEKYDFRGIWDKYFPLYKGEFYFGNKPHWTIDRENNVFLTTIDPGGSGRGNRKRFLLWLDGIHIVVEVALVEGSSGDLDANPFVRVWDLTRLDLPTTIGSDEKRIIQTLKESLRIYGYRGILKQRPNTFVEFKF